MEPELCMEAASFQVLLRTYAEHQGRECEAMVGALRDAYALVGISDITEYKTYTNAARIHENHWVKHWRKVQKFRTGNIETNKTDRRYPHGACY